MLINNPNQAFSILSSEHVSFLGDPICIKHLWKTASPGHRGKNVTNVFDWYQAILTQHCTVSSRCSAIVYGLCCSKCSVVAVVHSLSCVWPLCNPVNCSMPGFPVLHYLLEFALIHVPPYPLPLIFPRIRVFSSELTLHVRGPKYWSTGVSASTSVLPMNTQGSFLLGLTDLISCSPRDSQESSLDSQFESINSLALSLLYGQFSHLYMTPGKTKTLALLAKWHFCFLICSLKYSEGDGIFHHFCISLDLSSSYCCHCFPFPKPIRVSIVYIDFLCSSGEFW